MGSPQNPRARAREKARRARKNAVYDAKKAAETKTGGAAPAIAKGAASPGSEGARRQVRHQISRRSCSGQPGLRASLRSPMIKRAVGGERRPGPGSRPVSPP